MKHRLATYSMKTGGRVDERAARLWALVEAGGDLDLVPAGAFVGGAAGKRDACARARAHRSVARGEETTTCEETTCEETTCEETTGAGPTGRSRCTSSRVDSPRTSRMRFATRVSEPKGRGW